MFWKEKAERKFAGHLSSTYSGQVCVTPDVIRMTKYMLQIRYCKLTAIKETEFICVLNSETFLCPLVVSDLEDRTPTCSDSQTLFCPDSQTLLFKVEVTIYPCGYGSQGAVTPLSLQE